MAAVSLTPPSPTGPSNAALRSRLASPTISRNPSSSSVSSTSSIQAAPMRPPPPETRTAATDKSQMGSRNASDAEDDAHYDGPRTGPAGGRGGGWTRNGPRTVTSAANLSQSPQPRYPIPPSIITSSASPSPILTNRSRPRHEGAGGSPTTPRGASFAAAPDATLDGSAPLRVTISIDPEDPHNHTRHPGSGAASPLDTRGRLTAPSSPVNSNRPLDGKPRTLSVDAGTSRSHGNRSRSQGRDRRQSHSSNGSGSHKPGPEDWIKEEEIGSGAFSTVYRVAPAHEATFPTSPRPPKKYAMKVIDQSFLVKHKKVKYAMVERDAMIRISEPIPMRGHRRGISSSSSAGNSSSTTVKPRKSSVNIIAPPSPNLSGHTLTGTTPTSGGKSHSRDRLSIATTSSAGSSPVLAASTGTNAQPSPGSGKALAGRRPSRSADPPEMVPEVNEVLLPTPIISEMEGRSMPPSPVREESAEGHESLHDSPQALQNPVVELGPALPSLPPSAMDSRSSSLATSDAPPLTPGARPPRTPKKRRQSLATSEKSAKSTQTVVPSGRARQHPGFIKLHSTFNDRVALYFVMSLAAQGDMYGLIRKWGSFDINTARYYAAQMVDSCEFMHQVGVIHRDLKPENILIDDDLRTKISDFGSAKIFIDPPQASKDIDKEEQGSKRSFVGSADYVSPEVLRDDPADTAADIWAIGVILYQMIAGKTPFRGATDYLTFQRVLRKEMEWPEGFDEDAKDMIDSIFNISPANRPTATALKSHPFFKTIDWSTIWTCPVPDIQTGMRAPTATLANVDMNDIFGGVFDDDGDGFEYEYDDVEPGIDHHTGLRHSPFYDAESAARAVDSFDNPDHRNVYTPTNSNQLDPPRPTYAYNTSKPLHSRDSSEASKKGNGRKLGKGRGLSHGSESSGMTRNTLAAWLDSLRFEKKAGLHGMRRTSTSGFPEHLHGQKPDQGVGRGLWGVEPLSDEEINKWAPYLHPNENILCTNRLDTRAVNSRLPAFTGSWKPRQVLLTDFPRLVFIKADEDPAEEGELLTKGKSKEKKERREREREEMKLSRGEAVFGDKGSLATKVSSVVSKNTRTLVVYTAAVDFWVHLEDAEQRDQWANVLRRLDEYMPLRFVD
ncbi:AGC/PDK1 protein kinase [Cryptococcus wingfieldii CBS 7118]|uniref:non-specific serine/threonine protein kinase n=1 Tax=Cryptococcus wingfieldii CBS 7118 TaxID=1295528 RepID=A0A1E3K2X8_9TREE|nr:AGC/PDK1 protein kinase [Cryptococcus wingfieldii CBS 7118]ODO07490.1 AGC/PDK1 protein kinase [Cryptococcus wingfieldii CBS 7118]